MIIPDEIRKHVPPIKEHRPYGQGVTRDQFSVSLSRTAGQGFRDIVGKLAKQLNTSLSGAVIVAVRYLYAVLSIEKDEKA